MKIAFIATQFPAVSETFILRQITGLLERGHEVDIFAYSPPVESTIHEEIAKYKLLDRTRYINVYACSRKPVRLAKRLGLLITNLHKDPRAVLKALNVFKFGKGAIFLGVLNQIVPFLDKGPYDIVHCQFGTLGELGLLLRDTSVFKGKLITSFRGNDISAYVKCYGDKVYDDLFRRGDLFLCVSDHIKQKLLRLGCEEQKLIVHRSGLDTNRYRCRPWPAKRKARVRVLTVARLAEKKGVEYGIRAVTKVLKKYPRVQYRVAGDGPLREKLQGVIAELKVGDNVELLGWRTQEEIAELFQDSDILLSPSVTTEKGDEEGIPGVIMEAFAHGLPVVATFHAGIPEVVQDGDSGFLVPERDVDALALKLEWLVERPARRCTMGRIGRKFVKEHYDIEKLNTQLVEIYQEVLSSAPRLQPATITRPGGRATSSSFAKLIAELDVIIPKFRRWISLQRCRRHGIWR